MGFPSVSTGKESSRNAEDTGDAGSIPGWEDPLEEEMAAAPVFLPGKSQGQRSQMSCSPWGSKESDTTQRPSTHTVYWINILIWLLICGLVSNVYGFPGGWAGKESACNAGDLGSIPGSERSPGEGNGYPLQCSGLENSMDCKVHGDCKESDVTERLSLSYVPLLQAML